MGSVGAWWSAAPIALPIIFYPHLTLRARTRGAAIGAAGAAAISFLGYLLELWGRLARGGRQRRSRCLSFLSTSHTTRAHAREAIGAAGRRRFLFYVICLSYGVSWRGGRQRRSRCVGSWDRSRIERGRRPRCCPPARAPAVWVTVGLRRVLVRLRMVVGVGCLHQLSGWWCGVGGRSGPRLLLLLGRRLLASASVITDSAAGSRQGHLDTARARRRPR